MVSSREFDEEDEVAEDGLENFPLPERMFAPNHEPVGVRVSAYHTYDAIRAVLRVLEAEEVQYLRDSPFGTFISTAEKPSFSGRFGRFLLSRQLKVTKRHEAWFLFASNPIRFSLREFGIVTGLPCGKVPKQTKKKMRKSISDKSYWPTLFGKLESVSVKDVLRMLRRKTVKETNIRLKYACLALIASVLLPTTHNPKISKEHAELIKDIDIFFKHPWGRVGFDLLIGSLKKRDEVSLSQDTVALKGFVQAIQLVMVEAVPELTGVVAQESSSASEDDHDSAVDEDDITPQTPKISLSPGHARAVDSKSKSHVNCIISPPTGVHLDESEFEWSDEERDEKVDNLLKLVEGAVTFSGSLFKGGMTKSDVARKRADTKTRDAQKKNGKRARKNSKVPNSGGDLTDVAVEVVDRLKEELKEVKEKLSSYSKDMIEMRRDLKKFKTSLSIDLSTQIVQMRADIIDAVKLALGSCNEFNSHMPFIGRRRKPSSSGAGHRQSPSKTPSSYIAKLIADVNGHKSKVGRSTGQIRVDTELEDVVQRKYGHSSPHPINVDEPVHDGPKVLGDMVKRNGEDMRKDENFSPLPSFSLLLSQENQENVDDTNDPRWTTRKPTYKRCFSDAFGDIEASFSGGENRFGSVKSGREERKRKTNHMNPEDGYERVDKLETPDTMSQMIICGTAADTEYSIKLSYLQKKIGPTFSITVGGIKVSGKELSEVWDRSTHMSSKMMDVLIYQVTQQYMDMCPKHLLKNTLFLDTKFVTVFSRNMLRFCKNTRREVFKFPRTVVEYFDGADATPPFSDRYYFPFNFAKKHWIGVCVDCKTWTLLLLDCNLSFRNDKQITYTLMPIAEMFPYLLKQVGRYLTTKDLRPFSICRPLGIPQNKVPTDSSVTTALLIQAHALGGLGMCSWVTPHTLEEECAKLAVLLYEENGEDV